MAAVCPSSSEASLLANAISTKIFCAGPYDCYTISYLQHLGILRCGDAMVFYALKERLRLDDDSRVRYEAAKSLILLGNLSYFSFFSNGHAHS